MRIHSILLAIGLGATLPTGVAAQSSITYIRNTDVAHAFAKGAPLVEVDGYKVHASRRERPGEAEVHQRDTDIIYVLDGTATFVTGGSVVDGRMVEVDEVRGTSILAGSTVVLEKGDFIIVPSGTPHWFKEVRSPFLYYVVKVSREGE